MAEESAAAEAADVVWRYGDAMVRRDFDDVAACFAPNVCCVTAASGTFIGQAAIRPRVSVLADSVIEWHAQYPDPDEARAAAESLAKERG